MCAEDSTSVTLPNDGSGREPSDRGALTLRPRKRSVPTLWPKLTFALSDGVSCRLIPTLIIFRIGCTRPDASAYLLGGSTSWLESPLNGLG